MRRLKALILVLALALAGQAGPGAAQAAFAPALLVNGAVVTNYDIEQRMTFLDALGATGDLRALAIEQLTEDRVKLQAAEAVGLEVDDEALASGIQEFADQRGITVADVERVLAARGIDRRTLEDFVEAGLVWREIVQARFRSRAMPTEDDVDVALGMAANRPVEVVELGEIAIPFAEHGDTEAVQLAERLSAQIRSGATSFGAAVRQYSRSASAQQGGRLPPVRANQLPPAVRGQVLLMEPGDVTEPLPIPGGLAILQLVSLRLEPPASMPEVIGEAERQAVREELFVQRMTSFGQGYLQELVGDALIVRR
jgi:peptidyl-prolyl cis-trans isomerase SurA